MSSGAHTARSLCADHAVATRSEFPGSAEYVARVRHWLRAVLGACPAGLDAALLTSELVTNAILHSDSGHGGTFAVAVTHRASDMRVEVADQGGHWIAAAEQDHYHGRGLVIVSGLARAWGVTGDDSGRTVWFELDCP